MKTRKAAQRPSHGRSANEWAGIVGDWRRSGLSAQEFSRRHGLRVSLLKWWRWAFDTGRQKSAAPTSPTSVVGFVEVVNPVPSALPAKPAPARSSSPLASGVEIDLPGGVVVRVSAGFDRDTLRQVVAVLGEVV